MIFVTVGTQLAFPRLLEEMDTLAMGIDEDVIAQCGPVKGPWNNLTAMRDMPPAEFQKNFEQARIVVSHAGIGTILSAKNIGKPLIVLPRRHEFGEHRNDHQMATARYVQNLKGVHVAWNADDLKALIEATDLDAASNEPGKSHADLIARLKGFIDA